MLIPTPCYWRMGSERESKYDSEDVSSGDSEDDGVVEQEDASSSESEIVKAQKIELTASKTVTTIVKKEEVEGKILPYGSILVSSSLKVTSSDIRAQERQNQALQKVPNVFITKFAAPTPPDTTKKTTKKGQRGKQATTKKGKNNAATSPTPILPRTPRKIFENLWDLVIDEEDEKLRGGNEEDELEKEELEEEEEEGYFNQLDLHIIPLSRVHFLGQLETIRGVSSMLKSISE